MRDWNCGIVGLYLRMVWCLFFWKVVFEKTDILNAIQEQRLDILEIIIWDVSTPIFWI